MKNRAQWLVVAVAALSGVAGAVYAQTSSSPSTAASPSTATGATHWHHHGGMMGGMMMHTLHQLNLTDAQKQSVHAILEQARTQFQAQRQNAGGANFAALANPGDPNHAAALQDLQTRVTARIQARDQVQQQIYGLLTAEQKTQLASILAAKQAEFAQRSAS